MTAAPLKGRTDTAARTIKAPADILYRAFVDPDALAKWLPPEGMSGRMERFEPRVGGGYRMVLTYSEPDAANPGKSTEDSDVVEGRFVELVPNERVVQEVVFEAEDPAFSGVMTMTWALSPAPEGTRVTFVCENVPRGIRAEDHDAGMRSSLGNLAAFAEGA